MYFCPIDVTHVFESVQAVFSHVSLYHLNKPRSFFCRQPDCGKKYNSWHGFTAHFKLHSIERGNMVANAENNVDVLFMNNGAGVNNAIIDNLEDDGILNEDPSLNLDYFVNNFYGDIQMYVAGLFSGPIVS